MLVSTNDFALLLQHFLHYALIPAWMCTGLADWTCHPTTHIECTGGTKESLLHIPQLSEVGLPLLLALFCEINALVIALMIGGLVLHQATAMWDVRWANDTRSISPTERHVHSVLEMAPVMVCGSRHTLLACCTRPDRWPLLPFPFPEERATARSREGDAGADPHEGRGRAVARGAARGKPCSCRSRRPTMGLCCCQRRRRRPSVSRRFGAAPRREDPRAYCTIAVDEHG